MTHRHPSHYFDNTDMFLGTHPDKASLAVLMKAVLDTGCPGDMIDDIINSAIAQYYNRVITPKEDLVTVINDDGKVSSTEGYNPFIMN